MDWLKLDKHNETKLTKLQREYRKGAAGVAVKEKTKPGINLKKEIAKSFKDGVKRKSLDFHLKQLTAEKDMLDKQIFVAYGKENETKHAQVSQELRDQVESQEQMKIKIISLKTVIMQLKSQIIRLEDEELKLSTKTESEDQFYEHLRKARLQLKIYECRLENTRQKEGIATADNKRLRQLIGDMLSDRRYFNSFWSKYIGSLSHNKKFLLDMIERAILAFNQGEDLCFKLDALRQHSTSEKKKNVARMLKMKRKQDSNQNMYDFLGGKGKKREIALLEKRELERRSEFKQTYSQKLNFYHVLIEKIQEFTGLNGIEQSMKKYEKQDDEFFSNFNYLIEMNSQIEYSRQSLKDTNDDYYSSNIFNKTQLAYDENYMQLLNQNLKKSIENTLKVKAYKDKYEKEIEGFLNAITELLAILNCNLLQFRHLLGNHKQVTIFNLNLFLKLLEQQTNTVLSFVYCDQRHSRQLKLSAVNDQLIVNNVHRNLKHPVALEDIVLMQQCAECAEGEDVNRYDEEIVYPLDFEAIKEKVRQKVQAPEMRYRLHAISQCRLPRSRTIVNKRYI